MVIKLYWFVVLNSSGIPITLEQNFVKQAIRKASRSAGSLFKDEVYVPCTDDPGLPPGDSSVQAATANAPSGLYLISKQKPYTETIFFLIFAPWGLHFPKKGGINLST